MLPQNWFAVLLIAVDSLIVGLDAVLVARFIAT